MMFRVPAWSRRSAVASPDFAIDPDFVTTPVPKTLWIELTSKCPFDCVFCTRRARWGAGQNLDFDIYRGVISELEEPDFIGLNYSGESIYYPQLLAAIELAAATGAATELVTAFSTISEPLLRGLAESNLDRLAISLHTMDPVQYRAIYRFGSLDLLKRTVAEFRQLRAALGRETPRLDFCFVAMAENLDQLMPVAEFAGSAGAAEISVHPVIGRHAIPHDFSRELSGNRLRSGFKDDLRSAVAAVRQKHPEIAVNVLNPDLDPDPRVGRVPGCYALPLPDGARIYTCDQSPFESVHILAGGDVVACEVHDEVSLGNLHMQSLRTIWTSERYRQFRRKYVDGEEPRCRSCVWKQAYLPGPFCSRIDCAEGANAQLLRGWHSYDADGVVWSRKHAIAALANPRLGKRLRIWGALPPGPAGTSNSLSVVCNHTLVGAVRNTSPAFLWFDTTLPLPECWDPLLVEFSVAHPYRPSLRPGSTDSRDLGMGLRGVEVSA